MSATPSLPAPTGPSDTVRSVVSFLLFLHLFALGVGVLSRATEGAPLETKLRDVPGVLPYIQLLGIDWSYTFPLVAPLRTGQPDLDHRIVVELKKADGSTETIVFPDRAQVSGPRLHRYKNLVTTAVDFLQAASMESKIPENIARSLVREYQATGGTIRILGKVAPEEAYGNMPTADAAPMYEAQILVVGDGVNLLKKESAADSAPASATPRPTNTPLQ